MDEKNVKNPLSNYSYINKDFNNVWAELLAITSKLSAKWDPVASNESDPGVVLIKLISLLADKLNYNLDANMLELFPSTVAQPANAREIFSCLGYTMKWYRSGTGKVTMQYKTEDQEVSSETNTTTVSDDSLPETVTIPQFSMICTEDSDIIYTMLEEAMLYTPTESNIENGNYGIVTTVNVMQGIITDYELLGDNKITANNLDSKFRLYFNEHNVAENGIFISNINSNSNYTEWKKVDNLNTQAPQSKVYKFGVTKDGVCYIEFPKDVAPLMTDGLYIKYILSEGTAGNIAQYNLRKFYNNPSQEIEVYDENDEISTTTLTFTENNVAIQNAFAISNGFDPESIDEAYENYTRTVGVFNTLVSLRDYTDALYTLGQNNEWISNVIVTDRTNDIQSGYNIISKTNDIQTNIRENVLKNAGSYLSSDTAQLSTTYGNDIIISSNNPYGGQSELALIYGSTGNGQAQENPNDSGVIDPGSLSAGESNLATVTLGDTDLRMDDYEVTPFDLKLYMLHYSPDPQSSLTNYNKTFQMVDNIEGDRDEIVDKILNAIDDYKSIQHNFVPILANRPAIFINTYPVKATIIPQYRVTDEQSKDIRENIYRALFKTFNSQNVDFGEEITYDEVYDIISEADERIKSIILDPIKFTTNVVFYNTLDEYKLTINGTEYTIKKDEWNMIPFDINTVIPINESEKVNWGIDCFAKSVLAGRTNLYETDSAFNFSLAQNVFAPEQEGEDKKKIVDKANYISTEFNAEIPTSEDNALILNANENIYIQAPSYYDATNYSSGVKYEYNFTRDAQDGVDYKLTSDEYIIFYYKENDSDTYYRSKYYRNITICPKGVNLPQGEYLFAPDNNDDPAKRISETHPTKYPASEKISESTHSGEFKILSDSTLTRHLSLTATKSISIRKTKETTVKGSDNRLYYWILNQSIKGSDDESIFRLFDASDTTSSQRYQLKLNEFFLVCAQDMSTINVYGSGTVLTRSLDGSNNSITNLPAWEVKDLGDIDINDLGTDGIKKLSTTLPNGLQINLKEMQFVVLGKDAKIYTDNNVINVTGDPQSIGPVGSIIHYKSSKSDPEWTDINQLELSAEELENLEGWSIYSNLNINISPESPQELLSGHKVILTDTEGKDYTYSGDDSTPTYLQSSISTAFEGGKHIDISQKDIYTEEIKYPEFVGYTQPDVSAQSISIVDNFDCLVEFKSEDASAGRITKNFTFGVPEGEYIIPVLISSANIEDLRLELGSTGASIQLLNNVPNSTVYSTTVYITSPTQGSWHYVKLTVEELQATGIILNVSIADPGEGSKKVKFGGLTQRVAREYDSYDGNFEEAVLARINALDTEGRFDYSYEIPEEDYIEDPLDPLSFLNSKHIFNKFTICMLQPTTKKYTDNTTGDITVTNKIK